ncbi:hypothetical protein [Methylosinus sp. Ce-a6]|uniref:hypothetical protein n=1 Tax=Methylosinus sp. Ce-a6 TaxID=2172005 RepID=UPI00135BF026|nr:hypothetical protein [Methylosinus sp. Ce-a6]
MSYETTNYLSKGVSKRHAAEFAKLLGYKRAGNYAHLGISEVLSMIYFDEKDYRSWRTIELSIGTSEEKGVVYVHTRTQIGRSYYDFEMQNRTVREFRRRFGGAAVRDGGNGEGYAPGPPIPPAASGCHLAMERLDWNLTRVNCYLHSDLVPRDSNPLGSVEKIWPQLRELNPDVFVSNVLMTYLISAMEDYFKSSYVALLTYAEHKQKILKGVRLSGEQLVQISTGTLTVEQAAAELLSFQRLAAVGRHFAEIDQKLDVLAPLKRPYRRRKVNLLDRLEDLVTRRHELIHGMHVDSGLDRKKLEDHIHDLTVGISYVYKEITRHYGWPFKLPLSSNFFLTRRRRAQRERPEAIPVKEGNVAR